jgi:two-component system response regulator HydG
VPSALSPKIAAVDDDAQIRKLVKRALEREGYRVATFGTAGALFEALGAEDSDAAMVLTDLHMPGIDGMGVLEHIKQHRPGLPVVFLTGESTVSMAVGAMRQGAFDYLVKPIQPVDRLAAAVRRALEFRRLVERNRVLEGKLSAAERYAEIVGSSAAMQEVFTLIDSVTRVDVSVLICGESGTGKELVARAIHDGSARGHKPFVPVNCGALTDSLLESELFGHVRGAFTGALESRPGLFEEASGSTLFLDEVGELPLATQVKLLRVLQEGEVRPVGANLSRKVDVRIVAATHRDLGQAVSEGLFREDLYYRLNVLAIDIPPLRERRDDIVALVDHFVRKHAARMGRGVVSLDEACLARLSDHDWPGNARELENVIVRAMVLAKSEVLTVELLPANLKARAPEDSPAADPTTTPLAEARDAFERSYLERALRIAHGNVAEAARLAGLDASNLRRTLKRAGLDPKDFA